MLLWIGSGPLNSISTRVSNGNYTAMHGYTSPLMAPQLGDLANAAITRHIMLNCLAEGIIKFYGYQNAIDDDLLTSVNITQHLTATATARQDLCS